MNILQNKKIRTIIVVLLLVFVFSFAMVSDARAENCLTSSDPVSCFKSSLGSIVKKAVGGIADTAADVALIPVRLVLWAVHGLTLIYFALAGSLFSAIIKPEMMSGATGIFNNDAVRDVWKMTRDFFNMFFILVLLFSAFCTIFQVEKWNIKKIWVNVLIAALLVNFSFTIARFIIDISNVAMYYFINNMFRSAAGVASGGTSGSSIFSSFGTVAHLSEILAPDKAFFVLQPISYQLIMIVFTFILAQTLMTIAVFFLIRLTMLTILIMFAPIGFVGYIFPGTSKYADAWWEKLFKYSFFGPVMIFLLAVSLHIAAAISNNNAIQFKLSGVENGGTGAGFLENGALFCIPVVLLWSSLGIAQSAGIAGAATVIGTSRRWSKAIAMAPLKYSGISGGVQQGWQKFKKDGKLFGKKVPLAGSEGRENREALIAGTLSGGKRGREDAQKKIIDARVAERMKEFKDRNLTTDQIAAHLGGGDAVAEQAAIRSLIDKKGALDDHKTLEKVLVAAKDNVELKNRAIDSATKLTDDASFDADAMNNVLLAASGGGISGKALTDIQDKIKDNVKKENVKVLIEYDQKHNRSGRSDAEIYQKNLRSLSAEQLGKQRKLHENIASDTNLQNYILTEVASDPSYHQEMFKHMKKEGRAEYASMGMHP